MRKLREIFLKAALIAAAVITGGILLFLIGIILKRGLPQLSWSFLTTATSYLAGTTGILPNICNTLYLILIAMGVALPLGVGAAVYITEYAENPRVVRLISFAAATFTAACGACCMYCSAAQYTALFAPDVLAYMSASAKEMP